MNAISSRDETRQRQMLSTFLLFVSSTIFSIEAFLSGITATAKDSKAPMALDSMFESFSKAETSMSNQPLEHLVRPSGSLLHSLGFLLHWPTFTTTNSTSNGEIADDGSPILGILLRKGFHPAFVLFLDRYCR